MIFLPSCIIFSLVEFCKLYAASCLRFLGVVVTETAELEEKIRPLLVLFFV